MNIKNEVLPHTGQLFDPILDPTVNQYKLFTAIITTLIDYNCLFREQKYHKSIKMIIFLTKFQRGKQNATGQVYCPKKALLSPMWYD